MALAEDAAAATAATTAGRRRRVRSFAPRYPGWLTLPSLAYYLIFFVGPMAILAVFSVATQSGFGSVSYAFDTSQYSQLWDSLYFTVFWHTLLMAAGGTLCTAIIGYPIAYWMSRYLTTGKSLALLAIVLPFWTSFLIRTYSWLVILDPQGYLARFLNWTGLTTNWNVLYTWKAIGIGLVYNYLPLFVLPVYAALERMDWSLIDAATDLGASPFTAFREITLPLTRPGLITGALLVFIPMTGEYVIPNVLGGGKFEFVGSVIGDNFIGASNWPFGSAMSIALMAVLSIFVVLYIVFATREEQYGS
jgi:spermidine/putrescine transport system permease protein